MVFPIHCVFFFVFVFPRVALFQMKSKKKNRFQVKALCVLLMPSSWQTQQSYSRSVPEKPDVMHTKNEYYIQFYYYSFNSYLRKALSPNKVIKFLIQRRTKQYCVTHCIYYKDKRGMEKRYFKISYLFRHAFFLFRRI